MLFLRRPDTRRTNSANTTEASSVNCSGVASQWALVRSAIEKPGTGIRGGRSARFSAPRGRREYRLHATVCHLHLLAMPIADVPAIVLGDRITTRIPVKLVHSLAAAIFAALAIATLLGAGEQLGL